MRVEWYVVFPFILLFFIINLSLQKHIEAAIKKLEGRHEEHIAVYGEGNELRLTGRHETGAIDQFSYGVANRGASIRIPRECAAKGYGYFEDRRPASNADPYQITGIMM